MKTEIRSCGDCGSMDSVECGDRCPCGGTFHCDAGSTCSTCHGQNSFFYGDQFLGSARVPVMAEDIGPKPDESDHCPHGFHPDDACFMGCED